MPIALLLFIVVPLIEIALFIQVGDAIGVLSTVALVVITAVIGVSLLRWQGLETMSRARSRMQAGEMPAREMAEGLMLLVAGITLLTPGFFTDAIGFVLLIPWSRYGLFRLVAPYIVVRGGFAPGRHSPRGDDEHTFEGEYRRTDNHAKDEPVKPERLDKK